MHCCLNSLQYNVLLWDLRHFRSSLLLSRLAHCISLLYHGAVFLILIVFLQRGACLSSNEDRDVSRLHTSVFIGRLQLFSWGVSIMSRWNWSMSISRSFLYLITLDSDIGLSSGVVGRERMGTAFPHKKLSGNGVPTREIWRDIFS